MLILQMEHTGYHLMGHSRYCKFSGLVSWGHCDGAHPFEVRMQKKANLWISILKDEPVSFSLQHHW